MKLWSAALPPLTGNWTYKMTRTVCRRGYRILERSDHHIDCSINLRSLSSQIHTGQCTCPAVRRPPPVPVLRLRPWPTAPFFRLPPWPAGPAPARPLCHPPFSFPPQLSLERLLPWPAAPAPGRPLCHPPFSFPTQLSQESKTCKDSNTSALLGSFSASHQLGQVIERGNMELCVHRYTVVFHCLRQR
jgi:hypothetical protein